VNIVLVLITSLLHYSTNNNLCLKGRKTAAMTNKIENDSGLVYSTEGGRMCSLCRQPIKQCTCRKKVRIRGGGVIRVRREIKGRKGKTVTTLSDLPHDANMKNLAHDLKQKLGTGGSVKNGMILLQGNHTQKVISLLQEMGFQVKKTGG
jgi:translation initiation factor 1